MTKGNGKLTCHHTTTVKNQNESSPMSVSLNDARSNVYEYLVHACHVFLKHSTS